jgi:phosphohistidine swiveling domain-containing protein
MESGQSDKLVFEAPGPGSWKLDPVHFPRPVTRYWAEMHPGAIGRGTSDFAEFYGLLFDRLDAHYINGFSYMTVVPVAPDAVPRRLARAAEVFEKKLWREQLYEWDDTVKPASIAKHRQLLSVDPDKLSDGDLTTYLQRCAKHHADMVAQHMRYTEAAVVPTGDFLAHLQDWTDHTPAELLDLMRGTAPVSAGASDEFHALVSILAENAEVREKLAGAANAAAAIREVLEGGGEAGKALSAYLALVGYRLLDGFDISEPCAIEMPDVLIRSVLTAVEGKKPDSRSIESRIVAVRAEVPAQWRDEFNNLLAEARLTYRLRDERGIFSDIWASGIMRRAALAAGRRLAEKGRIEKPAHFVDASMAEMGALLSGSSEPAAEELARRAAYRARHRAFEAPMTLGPQPEPPDLSQLPPLAARMMRATDIALSAVFGSSEAEHEEDMLRGLAASKGVYEGPARRVSGPAEFGLIKRGDILVTESTTEAFNILLPLLGAIVTDSGGLLSHSAIVAREYGIPGVVGTREATRRIADGARLRVDGTKGEVSVIG